MCMSVHIYASNKLKLQKLYLHSMSEGCLFTVLKVTFLFSLCLLEGGVAGQ